MFFSKPQPIALPLESSDSESDYDSDYDPEIAIRPFGEGHDEDEKGPKGPERERGPDHKKPGKGPDHKHEGGKHHLHLFGEGHDEDKKGPKGPDRPRGPDHKKPGKGPDHKPEGRKDPEDHKGHKEKKRRGGHKHKKSKLRKTLYTLAHAFIIIVGVRWLFSEISARTAFKGLERHSSGDMPHAAMEKFDPISEVPGAFDTFTPDQCLQSAVWSEPAEAPAKDDNRRRGKSAAHLSSKASFVLPVSSESLAFYSFGPHTRGIIEFVEDDTETVAADEIAVDVEVRYEDPSAFEEVTVCALTREAGHGIGIFTPHGVHRARRHAGLKFKIMVRFPKSSEGLVINSLETHLPFFSHKFHQSAASIHFNSLSVENSPSSRHRD